MTEKKPRSYSDDALAREVDKLLRKLPMADPYLKGDPEPSPQAGIVLGEAPSVVLAARRRERVGPTSVQRISVWVRVALGGLLGAVITQWPYSAGCGLGLSLYLGAIAAVLVGGAWGAVWSWRYRMALAHATSLAVIYWGSVLIANQVLQRVGYAATSAAWSCGGAGG